MRNMLSLRYKDKNKNTQEYVKIMSTNKGNLTFANKLAIILFYVMMMINFGKLCKVIYTPKELWGYSVQLPNLLL